MMNIFSAEEISKQYSARPLFHNASFGLAHGERVGVIGVNGSGKSTLLRIIAGVEEPDRGRVAFASNLRLAYLPQMPELDPQSTVLETVFDGETPAMRLLRNYERVSAQLLERPTDEGLLARLNDLSAQIDRQNAWDVEAAARAIISRLGLADQSATPVGLLSGGQRKRAAMAQALVADPDLLILDEPTNHIDTETVEWLEEYLARFNGALLLVTHDRYFLDRIVSHMIEIDRGKIYRHNGNYSAFVAARAERNQQAAAAEDARQNLLRKEIAWLRRGAQARTTKQKAHVERVYALMDERPDAPQSTVEIDLGSRRIGKRVLEIQNLTQRFGDTTLIDGFSFELKAKDRVGVVGPNGSGKSTLLNLIAGRLQPDSGSIRLGETIHIAYYDQESLGLNEELRVVDYIREAAEQIRGSDGALVAATQMLERFLFPPEAQWALIRTLSGGERRRLYLLRTLMFQPNLLLLDEPTNDLDIQTLTVLEDYLDSFQGAVIAVSHDRYFLDRVAQRIIAFEDGGKLREYPGNYERYAEYRRQKQAVAPATKAVLAPKAPPETKQRRLSSKERRELAELEERVGQLEARKAALGEELNAAGSDYQRYQMLAAAFASLESEIEQAVERWAELAELAD
jgi:ATP-binding cassette subfamily F protein uup